MWTLCHTEKEDLFIMEQLKRLLGVGDKSFYRVFFRLCIPLVIQQGMASALYLVDNIMIGRLGEIEIAAVSVSNQLSFLLQVITFGLSSGACILIAQFYGKGDQKSVKKTMGLMLMCAVAAGLFFTVIGVFFGGQFIDFFSDDAAVIAAGKDYLFICGIGFLARTLSLSFAGGVKSCGNVKLPMIATCISVAINTFLNYCLIFGNLGMPKLGVQGAAIATLIASVAEVIMLFSISIARKDVTLGKGMFIYDKAIAKQFWKTGLPVLINEIMWSTGTTLYYVFYGKIGTNALAAAQIYKTLDTLGFIVLMATGSTCAIMLGNKIGEGKKEEVKIYAKRHIALSLICGIVTGAVLFLIAPEYVKIYNVSAEIRETAITMMTVYCCSLWLFMVEHTMIIGVLRAGGDTVFSGIVDVVALWCVAIPALFITGLGLGWPVWAAFLASQLGSAVKFFAFWDRIFKWKWINDVTAVREGVVIDKV